MNTYRIYEDFKATLGDAAAKSLAQTLGAMFDELKDTVRIARPMALPQRCSSR